MNTTARAHELRAVILAGGEGLRLSSLTYRVTGKQIPKQFCPLLGSATLLQDTIHRVSLAFPSRAIITVVTRSHEGFYQSALAGVSPETLLVQPSNRGTAAAMLYALLKHAEVNPAAIVAVFPSDHYVSDDGAFMRYVALAVQAVSSFPSTIVLLGAEPTGPEVDYGWIEAAEPLAPAEQTFHIRRVRQFWEQPSLELARRLLEMECLWNTFVLVASLPTLLDMIMKSVPKMYAGFVEAKSKRNARLDEAALTRLYDTLPSIDLSGKMLSRGAKRLGVLPLNGVGWSDLDEPGRAFALGERLGLHLRSIGVSMCRPVDEMEPTRISSRASGAKVSPLTSRRQWRIRWLPSW
jgi:mannose-1-phosphate guanylyltransferase